MFKNILREELNILNYGDIHQLTKYDKKYSYSAQFSKKHDNYVYINGKWLKPAEYEARMTDVMKFIRSGNYNIVGFNLLPIKANRLISIGEICVIPIETKIRMGEKAELETNDWIFVRNLEKNKWYVFTYLESVNQKDFKEFFPDFPIDIQLK
ncbi:hypothetical protein [Acinetobacter dispersus]|uniref:hypothetical protein n=1 Tax=Acinetobacter dispersus TaxID=70348 RepID=UPI0012DB4482|nr:hypothetical protein [Acinetobacter dispersus]